MIFDEPILLKASLLLSHGERERAIQAAIDGYWHFKRTGYDTEKLETFLEGLAVELTPPPKVTTGNKSFIRFLDSTDSN